MNRKYLFKAIAAVTPLCLLGGTLNANLEAQAQLDPTLIPSDSIELVKPRVQPQVQPQTQPQVQPQTQPQTQPQIQKQPTLIQQRAVPTLEAAKTQVIQRLYDGQVGNRALFGKVQLQPSGARIASWRRPDQVVVERPSWFFFVDEQPGANWEHAAKYILVDQETGEITSIPSTTPPQELPELRPFNRPARLEIQRMRRSVRELRVRATLPQLRILQRDRYAVLLSGGFNSSANYSRYWNDLSFIYKALRNKYGYQDNEIIVLYANGTHSPSEDLDGNGTNDIDYAATKANLTTVMNSIKSFLKPDGKFFFYSTNHGGLESGYDATLYLWGEWIRDDEFANLTKGIKAKNAIYVMEQCYSGGMMDYLLQAQTYPCGHPEVCVMTAARYNEPSWAADTEGNYDEYVYHWTAAVYGQTPTGTPVNADANGDGKVSMREAHDYARTQDSRNEHPQVGSCISSACRDATL